VRAKKANTPKKTTQPVRYLLSGDRKLQRLSLKKVREEAKARKRSQSRRRKPVVAAPAVAKPVPARPAWATDGRALLLGGIGVVAAVVVMTAGFPAERAEVTTAAAPVESVIVPEPVRPAARPEPDVIVETSIRPAALKPEAPRADPSPRQSPERPVAPVRAAAQPVAQTVVAPVAEVALAVPKPAPAAPTSLPEREEDDAPVTLTGCLAFENQTYRLKDVAGAEAPKSRNWRSGFLRKRASPVELMDARGSLSLASHVGQRVAATGTLTDREMRVRSLQRVSASCT
jgi:hypothetical protein